MQLRLVRRVVATLGTITLLSAGLFTSDAAMASSPDPAPVPAAASSSVPAGYHTAGRAGASAAAAPDLVSASSCGTGRIAVSGIPAGALLFIRSAPNTSAPLVTTSAPNGAQFDCIAVVPGEPYTVCGVTGNGWMLIPLFGRPPTDVGFAPASCFSDV